MLLVLFLVSMAAARINNVCKTYSDYATKLINPNCWYNPDVDAQPSEMVLRQGFPFESYRIVTVDGYILSLFRIPHNSTGVGNKRQPVYVHHGLGTSSLAWYNHGPRSLAFALSNQGYDVWIANTRGTMYSLGHVKYTIKDRQYWNFSFHEVGLYDVSANLRFIHKMTGQKVVYIGFSFGTTYSYVYAMEKNNEAHDHIKGIISLAPTAYTTRANFVFRFLSVVGEPLQLLGQLLGIYSLEAHPPEEKTLINRICVKYPFNLICVQALFSFLGTEYEELLPEELPLLFNDLPDGISVKFWLHHGRNILMGGRFGKFDYGPVGNLKTYGSAIPPEYDVKKIDFCVRMLYGLNDRTCNPHDVRLLHKKLRCSTLDSVEVNKTIKFNHIDMAYAKDVDISLNPIIFRRIKEILNEDRQ